VAREFLNDFLHAAYHERKTVVVELVGSIGGAVIMRVANGRAVIVRARRPENRIIMRADQNDRRRGASNFDFNIVTELSADVVTVAPRPQPSVRERLLAKTFGQRRRSARCGRAACGFGARASEFAQVTRADQIDAPRRGRLGS